MEQAVMDEMLKDLRLSNERSLDQLRVSYMEQVKQAQMHSKERIDELTKQNDGLLGAVGRLQGEREAAVKKLDALEREHHAMQAQIAMKVHEMGRENALERQKFKDEIAGLKAKIKKPGKK